MKLTVELAYHGGLIAVTFEDVISINKAIKDFWELVKEEEGPGYAQSAKCFGRLSYYEVE